MRLLRLSIFLIVEPRIASIKMSVNERKSMVLLTFYKKVSKVSKVSLQKFIGQEGNAQMYFGTNERRLGYLFLYISSIIKNPTRKPK